MLNNKRVLIGVTGGIAIYRVLDLISLLKKEGATVKIILTSSAINFVTPLTFKSVIGDNNSVFTDKDFFDNSLLHIELAKWADIVLVAPTSANTIAKIAAGITDNLLLNVLLASKQTIVLAPAMNPAMWQHNAVQSNISIIINRGIRVWGPQEGKAVCGDFGFGRMLNISLLRDYLIKELFPKPLLNKKVIVAAGPTVEELDSVRFISNYSSGKMGYSLAKAASFLGADVTLISGPSVLECPIDCNIIKIKSAIEMEEKILIAAQNADFVIMAAAVADFRVSEKFSYKLTKTEALNYFKLVLNPDILANLRGNIKGNKPYIIGFAIQSEKDLLDKAKEKLIKKNANMIIANKIGFNTGFNSDTNEVYIITKENMIKISLMEKTYLAIAIWVEILELSLLKDSN